MKRLGMALVCALVLIGCEGTYRKIGIVTAITTEPRSESSNGVCEVRYRLLTSPQVHIDRVEGRASSYDNFRDCSLLRVGDRITVLDGEATTRIDWANL